MQKDIYTLKNIKQVKWGLLEENNPIHLYPIMYPGWSWIIKNTGKVIGKYQTSICCLQIGVSDLIFVNHREWNELGEYVLRKILRNPNFVINLNKKILKLSDDLTSFTAKKIHGKNLKKKSNRELFRLYEKYERHHGTLYCHAIPPVYLELYKPHLTTHLVEYLQKQIKKSSCPRTPKECFAILTIPEKYSKVQNEERSFLRISKEIRRNKKYSALFKKSLKDIARSLEKYPTLKKKIKKHMDAFRYLSYNFEGPAFSDNYFFGRWREIIRSNENPRKLLANMDLERRSSARQRNEIIRILNISPKYQKFFSIARGIIYGKDYRKMALVRSYYELEPLIREIARRTYLTINELRNCLLPEIKDMLEEKIDRPPDLTKRMKGCVFVVIDRRLPGKVFVGEVFEKMKKHLENKQKFDEINYFHGQSAATGKAKGIVKIINAAKDLPKMKPGNVLVSQMTNPDLVPAMKQASAIITDLGGITCHAAIVSRELKIPCVIGTKIATQALKDGDEVIVDADQGEVRKIG